MDLVRTPLRAVPESLFLTVRTVRRTHWDLTSGLWGLGVRKPRKGGSMISGNGIARSYRVDPRDRSLNCKVQGRRLNMCQVWLGLNIVALIGKGLTWVTQWRYSSQAEIASWFDGTGRMRKGGSGYLPTLKQKRRVGMVRALSRFLGKRGSQGLHWTSGLC